MATPAYMSVTGEKQGLITAGAFTADSVGNTYQEGHEDQVMVQAFTHDVIIPRDPQSGQPTGQRVHKPVVITKVYDKASPLLQAALTSGERPGQRALHAPGRSAVHLPQNHLDPRSLRYFGFR
jgi:type VI secretion system secreted protein Hcp